MRIPSTAAPDVQQAFRDLQSAIAPWVGAANVDMKQRRLMNAGQAIGAFDYVTLTDLEEALARVQTELTAPTSVFKQVYYGTHAARLARPPATVPDGSFFEETDRGALYQAQQVAGVATWVLYFGFQTGSYSAKPGDLGLFDDNFWYNAQDQATLSRWTGAAWHYQIGNLIATFTNRPAGGGTNIADGFRFTASDRGYQVWAYDRTNTRWYFVGGGSPTSGTIANITGSLGAQDVGYLYYATDFDRIYQWTGAAYGDAPAQPRRGQICYFSDIQTVGNHWALCDGSSVTFSTPTGGTTSLTVPNLTGSNRFIRSISGATGGTGGSATTHTHPVNPPDTGSHTGPSVTTQVDQTLAGATVFVGANVHNHDTDIAQFNSGTPSGTGGDDALPPYLNLKPYIRL